MTKKPRAGKRFHITGISFAIADWDFLKEIERETGARPSVTLRRWIERERQARRDIAT